MEILFHKLGIDWKLLLSQGVNFLILLGLLTFLVYRPLLRLLRDREHKIKEGIRGAEEAARRLDEIEAERAGKLQEADRKAFAIVSEAEELGKEKFGEFAARGEKHVEELLSDARLVAEQQKEEERGKMYSEAVVFMRSVLQKTVNLDPKHVDESLVHQALEMVRREKRV